MEHRSPLRRYAILGTGAIGGYYGACLQKSGCDVHFLARSDYDHIQVHGLQVDSPDGDFKLSPVQVYASVEAMPPCDVIIVALKTTQNHLLNILLPPLLGEHSTVLLLQNGLNAEEQVAGIVGDRHRVMGGLCFICSNKVGPGHIRHVDYKAIAIGEYAPDYAPLNISDALEAIAQDFESAGIPIVRSEDLLLARWQKLLWNIPFNGLSVVLDATTDEMIHHPAIRQLAEDLMNEVRAIAAAYSRTIEDNYVEKILADTETMEPYRTSMKLDFENQNVMEVDAIFGNPLKAAQAKGISTPKLEVLYQQLTFLNRHSAMRVV
ncbi:MAG: putative 2-dehydropantoate 2-reductase [Leptolyngbyaceae bacterium]|nr:putative 2-dehydropantoate 2-reductase [Leptolyngbyaceae bacterium]